MCRLLPLLPLLAAVGCGYGFNPTRSGPPPKRTLESLLPNKAAQKRADGTPEQEAVHAALDVHKAKAKELNDALKAEAQPSDIKRLCGDLATTMKGHDLGPAPVEFKTAWKKHWRSWQSLQAAVARLPDAYTDTEFTDALAGLFKSDPNRGRSLGGDVVEAVAVVIKSHGDLYAAAEAAGLEVEK